MNKPWTLVQINPLGRHFVKHSDWGDASIKRLALFDPEFIVLVHTPHLFVRRFRSGHLQIFIRDDLVAK